MKYKVLKSDDGRIYGIDYFDKEINSVNSYLPSVRNEETYKETLNAINEVMSGMRDKKLLSSMSCEVLVQKDVTEIAYTPDIGPEDWEQGEYENRFTYVSTEKFKEAIEIWWKEQSAYYKNWYKNKFDAIGRMLDPEIKSKDKLKTLILFLEEQLSTDERRHYSTEKAILLARSYGTTIEPKNIYKSIIRATTVVSLLEQQFFLNG